MNESTIISLHIDEYDDIFSSFDSRDYSKRTLSDDFLTECKKASIDKEEGIELYIALNNSKLRNLHSEEIIKKRLKAHFSKHYRSLRKEHSKIINQGILFIIIGLIISVTSTITYYFFTSEDIIIKISIDVFQNFGIFFLWFLLWTGMNKILFETGEIKKDIDFYRKMSNSEIFFESAKILKLKI